MTAEWFQAARAGDLLRVTAGLGQNLRKTDWHGRNALFYSTLLRHELTSFALYDECGLAYSRGETALELAAYTNQPRLFARLACSQMERRASRVTSLMKACFEANEEECAAHISEIHRRDARGLPALFYAACGDDSDPRRRILALLRPLEGDVKTHEEHFSMFMAAAYYGNLNAIREFAYQAGQTSSMGETALMLACKMGVYGDLLTADVPLALKLEIRERYMKIIEYMFHTGKIFELEVSHVSRSGLTATEAFLTWMLDERICGAEAQKRESMQSITMRGVELGREDNDAGEETDEGDAYGEDDEDGDEGDEGDGRGDRSDRGDRNEGAKASGAVKGVGAADVAETRRAAETGEATGRGPVEQLEGGVMGSPAEIPGSHPPGQILGLEGATSLASAAGPANPRGPAAQGLQAGDVVRFSTDGARPPGDPAVAGGVALEALELGGRSPVSGADPSGAVARASKSPRAAAREPQIIAVSRTIPSAAQTREFTDSPALLPKSDINMLCTLYFCEMGMVTSAFFRKISRMRDSARLGKALGLVTTIDLNPLSLFSNLHDPDRLRAILKDTHAEISRVQRAEEAGERLDIDAADPPGLDLPGDQGEHGDAPGFPAPSAHQKMAIKCMDVMLTVNSRGRNALEEAVEQGLVESFSILYPLLGRDCKTDDLMVVAFVDTECTAIKKVPPETIMSLAGRYDRLGRSAIFYSIYGNNFGTFQILYPYQKNTLLDNFLGGMGGANGLTVLMLSLKLCRFDFVEFILDQEQDSAASGGVLLQLDSNGLMALHYALVTFIPEGLLKRLYAIEGPASASQGVSVYDFIIEEISLCQGRLRRSTGNLKAYNGCKRRALFRNAELLEIHLPKLAAKRHPIRRAKGRGTGA